MDKYRGKILLSDLDGTLLNSENKVSEENKKAISTFVEEGGKFGIATGRSLTNASAFLEGVRINGYCILANGGQLYDYDKKVYLEEFGVPRGEIMPFLKRCIDERPGIGVQVYAKDMSYIVSREEYADSCVVKDHLPVIFDSLENVMEMEWIKILFSGNEEEISWLKKESSYLEEHASVDRVRSAINYYEFLPVRINKGSMLTKLRQYLNDMDVIYAVGDYYNDIDMLAQADVGIATENAPDAVKEHADRICADYNNNAIADVIAHIIACAPHVL